MHIMQFISYFKNENELGLMTEWMILLETSGNIILRIDWLDECKTLCCFIGVIDGLTTVYKL